MSKSDKLSPIDYGEILLDMDEIIKAAGSAYSTYSFSGDADTVRLHLHDIKIDALSLGEALMKIDHVAGKHGASSWEFNYYLKDYHTPGAGHVFSVELDFDDGDGDKEEVPF